MKYIISLNNKIIQTSEFKRITKKNSKHFHNTLYVAFIHGCRFSTTAPVSTVKFNERSQN